MSDHQLDVGVEGKENDDRCAVKICTLKTIMLGVLERNTPNVKLL